MLLNEIMNSYHDLKIQKSNRSRFEAVTTIDDLYVEFFADRNDGNEWEVEFGTQKENTRGSKPLQFGMTDTGNQMAIFAFVKDAMFKFVEKHNPDLIKFSAANDGKHGARSRVYDKLLKRFEVPYFTLEKCKVGDNKEVFFLVKKGYEANLDSDD